MLAALVLNGQIWLTSFVAVQSLGQVTALSLAILFYCGVILFFGRRLGLLSNLKLMLTWSFWKTVLKAFLVLMGVKLLGSLVMNLEGVTTTANQASLEASHMQPIIMVLGASIMAPLVEELVFRGLLMGRVFRRQSLLGLLVSSLIFAMLHSPDSLGAWVLYGGMGLVLGNLYRRMGKLEYSVALHFLNNSISVVALLLALLFGLQP